MNASARFVERIRAEYLEMPGLRLKCDQVARLCGLERAACQVALDTLVAAGFLCVKAEGAYGRATDGAHARPRAVKADLRPRPHVAKAS
jgi:hypothetical protein